MNDDKQARDEGEPVPECVITRADISTLVDKFYDRVWADPRLGPIFSKRLDHNRADHLQRMKQFWASVLLRSGEYHGRPVPKHKALTEVVQSDFAQWLELFHETAFEVLEKSVAQHVVDKAEHIAASLWLAMFGTPGSAVPLWLKGANYVEKFHQEQLGAMST